MNLRRVKYYIRSTILKVFGKVSYSRIQLNDWLKKIEVKAERVLEVGPSFNPVVKKVKTWRVKTYKTLDNNLENHCNPDYNLDLNHLVHKNPLVKKVFEYKPEVIFCLEVMEYIYKPETVLKFFFDILAPGGILYISFHTIYPIHEPYRFDSLRYTKWGIINLLKDAGFSKWEVTPRIATKGKDELERFYKKEKMHTLKNSFLIFEIGYFIKAFK